MKFLSDGLTVKSDGYTAFKVAGKVTNLFLPKLSFTITSLPSIFSTASLIELILTLTLIMLVLLPKFTKNMQSAPTGADCYNVQYYIVILNFGDVCGTGRKRCPKQRLAFKSRRRSRPHHPQSRRLQGRRGSRRPHFRRSRPHLRTFRPLLPLFQTRL